MVPVPLSEVTSLHQAIAPDPLILTPQTPVIEAIATMSTARAACLLSEPAQSNGSIELAGSQASCILVADAGQLVGIFTERDVVRLSGLGPISPKRVLSEVMASPVVSLRQSAFTDIFTALNLFQQYRIRHLPILDDAGQVVGLVTHESLRQLLRPVDLLRLRLVTEVMTWPVVQAAPTTPVRDIARQMAAQRVSSIVIVERSPHPTHSSFEQDGPTGCPLGIVTERDIVQFQALGLDFETIQVHQVMSTPIFAVTPGDSLWTVQRLMQRHHVGRLVVVDPQHHLLGIVTQTSLLQALNPLELYKLVDSLEQKICQLEFERAELLQHQNSDLERQIQDRTQALQEQAERERLLSSIASRIRASLNLMDNLETAVTEIRRMLGSDRLLIYQFQADGSGRVVAESVQQGWVSALQHRINDPCFQLGVATRYQQGATAAIANIYQAGYPQCYVRLLESYQVKANLVVPLIVEHQLWGLLIGHQCSDYRPWQDAELEFLERIAVQLAIAIQQANAYERAQAEIAERQRREQEIHLLYQLTQAISAVDDFEAALEVTVRQICQLTQWSFGEIWVPSVDQTHLHLSPAWYCQTPELSSFREASLDLAIPRHAGLPGLVWATQQPVWIRDVSEESAAQFLRLAAAQASGLKAAFGVPIVASQGVVAVLVLLTTTPHDLDAPLLQLVTSAMNQLGQIIQRKRVEAQLSAVLNRASASIVSFRVFPDRSWVYDYYSAGCEAVFGYTPEEMMAGIWWSRIPTEDQEAFIGTHQPRILADESFEIQYRFRHKDGTMRWISTMLKAQRNEAPLHWSVIAVDTDITDRKQAELALRQSEKYFRGTFEQAAVGMCHVSPEGQFLRVNQRFCDIVGYTAAEVMQLSFPRITHPEDRDTDWEQVQQLLRGEISTYSQEKRYRRKEGSLIWVNLTVSLQRDRAGAPQQFIHVVEDITDRKQTEAALRHSESKTRALISALPDLTMRMSGDGIYLDFLPTKTFKIFGDDNLIGQGIYDGSLPLDLAELRMGYIRRALQTGELQVYEQQICIDGQVMTEEVRIAVCDRDEVIVIVRDISDRKRTEAALRESEAQNRAILVAIPDLMFQINAEGIYLTYVVDNRSFGLLPQGLCPVGQHMVEVLPPELAQRQTEYAQRALATGELQVYEQRLWIDPPGKWQHEEVRVVKSGEDQVLFIIRDITDRKQAEEALRQSEATKRAIIQAIPDLLIRVDRAGHHIETLSGGSVREILPPPAHVETPTFRDILPEELIPQRMQALEEAFATRTVQIYEHPIELAGQPCWEEVRVSPLDDHEVLLMIRDITHRKQAEETLYQLNQELEIRVAQRTAALRESEGRFRQVFEQSPVGIALSDLKGNLTRVNSSLAIIMDCTVADLLHHRIQDLLPFEEQQSQPQPLQELLEYTLTAVSFESQSTTREGNPIWVNVTSALIFNAFGRPASMVHLIEDISDRKQVEAELRHTNEQLRCSNAELERATRLKDEFLANMSHELRTPLNAILGMAEGLQEEVFGPVNESQLRAIATIERSGRHLLELINDILDLSKIESGALELQLAPVSVSHLCESSLMFVKQQALQKQIHLTTEIPPALPDLIVDERRLRQVLINLLNNAVKFTPAGGQVQFRVSTAQQPEGDVIRFSILDTGIGIATEDMHKLFKSFVQLDSCLARQYPGTGLGLALVRQLTELHGGNVTVTSEVGRGSCFTVHLPYRSPSSLEAAVIPGQLGVFPQAIALLQMASPSTAPMQLPVESSSAPTSQSVILLVEDNKANVVTLSSYLESRGYRVIVAHDGFEGIAYAEAQSPNLILMDIQMPGLDGLEAIQQLRANPATATIPIIALTALTMSGDRERCLAAGANDYYAKPVSLKQLLGCIQRLLNETQG